MTAAKRHPDIAHSNQDPLHREGKWKLSSLMLATLALSVLPLAANAISLGRVQVLSALGEPIRAEVEVTELSADEASSLQVSLATPEQFRAAGLEYNPVLTTARMQLQKRADGRTYLALSGDRSVQEPFVDLIVEVSWSAGRIVRDYTLLFDPKNLSSRPAVTPQLAQTTAPVVATPPAPTPRVTPAITHTPAAPKEKTATAVAKPAKTVSAQVASTPAKEGNITVKSGDTAGRIAQAHLEPGISLDQMLAAMLRQNPDAFIGNDINRIKAGAVIDRPSAEQAKKISADEAKQVLAVSAKNFDDYRNRLAQSPKVQSAPPAAKQAAGKVQAKVEDKAAPAAPADKLKLSKDMSSASANKADAVAKGKQAADVQNRTAELNKNMADLGKIAAAAGGPVANTKSASITPAASASAATPAKTATVAVTAAAPSAPASATATTITASVTPSATVTTSTAVASTASVVAQATTTAPRPKPKFTPPPPPPEPSMVDMLTEDPLLPLGAAGAVAAILGGMVYLRRRKQQVSENIDSSFLESRLQPDSFFGASGGKQIDTKDEEPGTGSSMMYSPSQLDAAGDVDPVAEAEVYIAYGRDLQAEEILKEALRTQGTRVAIHLKLLEIYAKRRDLRAFGLVSNEVFDLAGADSPDWQAVCRMGLEIDPANPLYQPGGKPAVALPSITESGIGSASFAASTMPHVVDAAAKQVPDDLDLDLDLGLFGDTPAQSLEPTVALQVTPTPQNPPAAEFVPPPPATPAVSALEDSGLEFDMGSLNIGSPAPAPAPSAPPTAAPLNFDMGGLSLDLPKSNGDGSDEDPMNTKLELAEEFYALGDVDGARSIAQEVASEASGGLKAKALQLLSKWV